MLPGEASRERILQMKIALVMLAAGKQPRFGEQQIII